MTTVRRKITALTALLLAFLLLCGCAAAAAEQPQYANPIRFYYLSREGGHNDQTGALGYQTVDLVRFDRTVADILEQYFSGPTSWDYVSPFPDGTRCADVRLDGGVLRVRLSEAYAQLSGVRLTLANACLTLTLEQLGFVRSVRIETSGSMLSGQRESSFTRSSFVLTDKSSEYPSRRADIYFVEKDSGLLRAERRQIPADGGQSLPELALDELLRGPASAALETKIPEGTQCVDLRVDGGVCTVVLSDSFMLCDTDVQSAQLAVRCITATLCAQDGVDRVAISLLSGKDLRYCTLQQTFAPEDSWFTVK